MQSLTDEPCLTFAYTQAGQENSFTWAGMKAGLEMQAPIFDSLRNAGKITVETLAASGAWFKKQYALTPPTAVTATKDYHNQGNKTVWYNSRFYRANVLWKNDSLRIRDIHLFDERLRSAYLDKPGTSTQCIYETLPFVDGYYWSKNNTLAGIRLVQLLAGGNKQEIACKDVLVKEINNKELLATWHTTAGQTFGIRFFEDGLEVVCQPAGDPIDWALELQTAAGISLPFTSNTDKRIDASLDNFNYHITCTQGRFEKAGTGQAYTFRMIPAKQKLVLNFKTGL
jgi:hypothetical protein